MQILVLYEMVNMRNTLVAADILMVSLTFEMWILHILFVFDKLMYGTLNLIITLIQFDRAVVNMLLSPNAMNDPSWDCHVGRLTKLGEFNCPATSPCSLDARLDAWLSCTDVVAVNDRTDVVAPGRRTESTWPIFELENWKHLPNSSAFGVGFSSVLVPLRLLWRSAIVTATRRTRRLSGTH